MSHRNPAKKGRPTEHEGAAHEGVWRLGATCGDCAQRAADNRARVWSRPPYVGVVPGGSKDSAEHRMHMDFDKDMNAYRDAKAEGLQPDHISQESVAKAQRRVKSQEAALRNAHKVGIEFPENVKLTPGVIKDQRPK